MSGIRLATGPHPEYNPTTRHCSWCYRCGTMARSRDSRRSAPQRKEGTVARRTTQQLKSGYDCVVVGAGNGGLAAAAQLAAAKGVKVLLLEQHNAARRLCHQFCARPVRVRGGAARVRRRRLAARPRATSAGSWRTTSASTLDWVEIPEAYRLILTDPGEELDVTMPYGVEAFIDCRSRRRCPGSREAVTQLCQPVPGGRRGDRLSRTVAGQSRPQGADRPVRQFPQDLRPTPWTRWPTPSRCPTARARSCTPSGPTWARPPSRLQLYHLCGA